MRSMKGKKRPRPTKEIRERAKQCRLMFCLLFPDAFVAPQEPKRPLAIGIHKQMWPVVKKNAPGISIRVFRLTMNEYVGGVRYLEALIEGVVRLNIDGTPAGAVTKEEAAHAISLLDKRKEWIERINKMRRRKK